MAQPDNLLDLLEDDEDEEVRHRKPEPPVEFRRKRDSSLIIIGTDGEPLPSRHKKI